MCKRLFANVSGGADDINAAGSIEHSIGATGTGFGANQFNPASVAFGTAAPTPGAFNENPVLARAAIPEPGSALVLGLGGVALSLIRRRKQCDPDRTI